MKHANRWDSILSAFLLTSWTPPIQAPSLPRFLSSHRPASYQAAPKAKAAAKKKAASLLFRCRLCFRGCLMLRWQHGAWLWLLHPSWLAAKYKPNSPDVMKHANRWDSSHSECISSHFMTPHASPKSPTFPKLPSPCLSLLFRCRFRFFVCLILRWQHGAWLWLLRPSWLAKYKPNSSDVMKRANRWDSFHSECVSSHFMNPHASPQVSHVS